MPIEIEEVKEEVQSNESVDDEKPICDCPDCDCNVIAPCQPRGCDCKMCCNGKPELA
jgi:hypothetical protein